MVIRKIGIINVQLAKDNFATRKHYHLKISTRNFFHFKLSARKIISLNLQFVKSNPQLAKSNLLLVILVPTSKITLQLVKLLCNS